MIIEGYDAKGNPIYCEDDDAPQTMVIIVRNMEPRYLRDPNALFETWVNERERAMKIDAPLADRIVGRLAGRYDIVTEDA